MHIYIFHRNDDNKRTFYPLELKDDADAIANAIANPGTVEVTDAKGRVVWTPKAKYLPDPESKAPVIMRGRFRWIDPSNNHRGVVWEQDDNGPVWSHFPKLDKETGDAN